MVDCPTSRNNVREADESSARKGLEDNSGTSGAGAVPLNIHSQVGRNPERGCLRKSM